jgi:hypothetical protein
MSLTENTEAQSLGKNRDREPKTRNLDPVTRHYSLVTVTSKIWKSRFQGSGVRVQEKT